MNETINWVHLTDLHIGGEKSYLWPKLKNELFKDLSLMVDKIGPIDVVFFTGDFVQSGKTQEFNLLTSELTDLWDHFDKLGNRPILCPVPGNHDVVRMTESEPDAISFKYWWSEAKMRERFWTNADDPLRSKVASPLTNYANWLNSLELPLPEMTKGILPGDFSATIKKGKRSIGVVGLNTTFLQIVPGDFKDKLDIHVSQLLAVCNNNTDRWLQAHDIGLLITHHPFEWLHASAKRHYRDEIYPPDRFHAHFCGHQHEPMQTDVSECGSAPRHFRQAPSIFGLEKYGQQDEFQRQHGYNAGQFEFEGNRGYEKIWPREAVCGRAGGMRLCADTHYDLTGDNCVITTFDVYSESVKNVAEKIDPNSQNDGTQLANTSSDTTPQHLALLDPVPDIATAAKGLAACARFKISPTPQHCSIRLEEQSQFTNAFNPDRLAWVTSDKTTGIDGFLSAALDVFKKQHPDTSVFRLHGEEATDTDKFEALFPQQFGMPMYRFCVLLAPLPSTFLLVTDIPTELTTDNVAVDFKRILLTLLDYCPNTRIILTSSMGPLDLQIPKVELRPLEPPDVRTYLLYHPDATDDLKDPDVIEKIYDRSDGLTVHIDRILRELRVSSLKSVLETDFDGTHSGETTTHNIPKGVAQAIDNLCSSKDTISQRSLRLLKVLSILPYGETIEGVHRFLPTEPFYNNNALQLNELGLVDVIPLLQSSLLVTANSSQSSEHSGPKLLKVPRQVRGYIQGLLTKEERQHYYDEGAEYFFGRKWRDGNIRPREVTIEYRESVGTSLGNEFAIIYHLLQEARANEDRKAAKRAADLAVYYCRSLRNKDRFRDLVLVADGILQVADSSIIIDNWAEIAYLYGLALRMTGKNAEAVTFLRQILSRPGITIGSDIKASIWLNIALGEERLKNKSEAIEAAKEVRKICSNDENNGFQANCIIEGLEKTGKERTRRLSELAEEALRRKMTTIANNLMLDLANGTTDPTKKVQLLNAVLNEPSDQYNKTRAIAEKAKVTRASATEMCLTTRDRYDLSHAYSYTHSQRLSSMFDNCHDGMWKVLEETGDVKQMLRLFRHSSFIWRIRGDESREAEYAKKLSTLKPPEESMQPPKLFTVEVRYFWKRFRQITTGK